jgi:hypothetical protein
MDIDPIPDPFADLRRQAMHADPEALRLTVELIIAHLLICGSRQDRLALYRDLEQIAVVNPELNAAMSSLLDERPAFERWQAYNRAERAVAEWVERRSVKKGM